jgi:hypothetical protein
MFDLTSFIFIETQTETADNALLLADCNKTNFRPQIQFVPYREQYPSIIRSIGECRIFSETTETQLLQNKKNTATLFTKTILVSRLFE